MSPYMLETVVPKAQDSVLSDRLRRGGVCLSNAGVG